MLAVMAWIAAFLASHAASATAILGLFAAQLGSTLPDLGTPSFHKVWAHDFFKAITASRSSRPKQ
jgi:hypothetical protein